MIPDFLYIPILILVFIYGIVVGSFLNVCIYRIPKGESIVISRSHCMTCGHQLSWYELIPLFSWIIQGGKCRQCKSKISVQYPIIEGANGALWVLTFVVLGVSFRAVLTCLLLSALLTLSVIDGRTHEIPFGINVFILCVGAVYTVVDQFLYKNFFIHHVIGFFAVSMLLYLAFLVTKGQGIGGGDIKLMAAAGLFLGWSGIIEALIFGCFLGAVIHILRMKITRADHVLAMGPYLSAGIAIAALWGDKIFEAYLKLFNI